MIPQSFIQDLLGRIDIVDVVETAVQLRKSGANYSACCPFHTEKSPSFTVSPTKQFYHCFGCGAHGTVIGFMMEYHGLGFIDAVKDLAARAGMTVPEPEPGRRAAQDTPAGPDLTVTLATAARYYKEQLKQSPTAIEYLKGRGLSGEIAARFGLGYAPDGWQNLEAAFEDYDDRALVDAGLVIRNDEGRRYDRFRDRVMFPIVGARGDIIGFGGRVIGQGEPKYLNSPETPVFEKGRELYGLFQARQAIRAAGRVLVVEGYLDVVALAQHGVGYAVATLGTATTPVHVQKLLRQTDAIVFAFDGDNAGRKAAWRALGQSLPSLADGKLVSFLFLPEGEDPDSYVRGHGKDAFEALVGTAEPLSGYLLRELRAQVDMTTPEGRAAFLKQADPLLRQIVAPNLALAMRDAVARAAGIALDRLEEQLGITRGKRRRAGAPPPQARMPTNRERIVLRALVARPDLFSRSREATILSGSGAAWATVESLVDALAEGAVGANTAAALQFLSVPGNEALVATLARELLEYGEDYDYAADIDQQLDRLREESSVAQSRSAVAGVTSVADLSAEARELLRTGGRAA